MTDALVQINDRLAQAASSNGSASITFFCECGDCLAEEVPLSLDEHEEIRTREDLIFAPGHDAPRRYRQPPDIARASNGFGRERQTFDSAGLRDLLKTSLTRTAEHT
jgi:hypothetical protein